jgi:hypothetical protein
VPPKSDCYFPRYFRYFFSSLVNEFFLDSAAPSPIHRAFGDADVRFHPPRTKAESWE